MEVKKRTWHFGQTHSCYAVFVPSTPDLEAPERSIGSAFWFLLLFTSKIISSLLLRVFS